MDARVYTYIECITLSPLCSAFLRGKKRGGGGGGGGGGGKREVGERDGERALSPPSFAPREVESGTRVRDYLTAMGQ